MAAEQDVDDVIIEDESDDETPRPVKVSDEQIVSDLLLDMQDRLSRGSGGSSGSCANSKPSTPTLKSATPTLLNLNLGVVVGNRKSSSSSTLLHGGVATAAAPDFPKTSPPASALPGDPFSSQRKLQQLQRQVSGDQSPESTSSEKGGGSRPNSSVGSHGGGSRRSNGGVAATLSRSSSKKSSSSSSPSSSGGSNLESTAATLAKLTIEAAAATASAKETAATASSAPAAALAKSSASGISIASSGRGGFPAPPQIPDPAIFYMQQQSAASFSAGTAPPSSGGVIPPFDVTKLNDVVVEKKNNEETASTDSDDSSDFHDVEDESDAFVPDSDAGEGSTNLVKDIHDKIKETAFHSSSSPLFLSSRLARFAGEKQTGGGHLSSGQPSPTDHYPNVVGSSSHLMHHQPFSDYTSPSASSSFYDNLGNSGSQGPSRSVSGTQQYQHFQYQQQRSPHQQSSHQQQQSHQKHLNLSPYLNSIDSGIISSPSSSSCNVFSSSSSHGLPPPPQHQQSLHLDPSGGQQPVHLLSLDPDEYLQKFHNRIKAVLVEAGRAKLTADTCAERVNSVIRSFPVELKTYEGQDGHYHAFSYMIKMFCEDDGNDFRCVETLFSASAVQKCLPIGDAKVILEAIEQADVLYAAESSPFSSKLSKFYSLLGHFVSSVGGSHFFHDHLEYFCLNLVMRCTDVDDNLSPKPVAFDLASVIKCGSRPRLASKLSVLESFLPFASHVLYQYLEGAMSSVENNLVTMITLWSNDQLNVEERQRLLQLLVQLRDWRIPPKKSQYTQTQAERPNQQNRVRKPSETLLQQQQQQPNGRRSSNSKSQSQSQPQSHAKQQQTQSMLHPQQQQTQSMLHPHQPQQQAHQRSSQQQSHQSMTQHPNQKRPPPRLEDDSFSSGTSWDSSDEDSATSSSEEVRAKGRGGGGAGNGGVRRGGRRLPQKNRGREGNRPPPPKEEPRRGGGQRGGMEGGDGGSVGGSGGGGRHDSQEIDFDERPTLPPPQIPWDHQVYNPNDYNLVPQNARFFVIKSYSEMDVQKSIKYGIWCSTEHGNRKLDQAYRVQKGRGPILLFFSVNGSGEFCGMAEMAGTVNYRTYAGIWSDPKWKGKFDVNWVYIKNVPNHQLKHIRLENNEFKPVTSSRDTQEVPPIQAKRMLYILDHFKSTSSMLDLMEKPNYCGGNGGGIYDGNGGGSGERERLNYGGNGGGNCEDVGNNRHK